MAYGDVLLSEYPFSTAVRQGDRDELLVGIVTAVWQGILDLPITPRPGAADLDAEGRPVLTGIIHVVGPAWNGTVALACPPALAAEFASRMLEAPIAGLTPVEVEDAWGELVNMVGGNLKAMVPPPTQLSLPAVIVGDTYAYRVPTARVLNELTFACLGDRIRLTVLLNDSAAA